MFLCDFSFFLFLSLDLPWSFLLCVVFVVVHGFLPYVVAFRPSPFRVMVAIIFCTTLCFVVLSMSTVQIFCFVI
jgi:hypothetical protein